MAKSVRVVGLGGSLRDGSTSHSALRAALDGALSAGAQPVLMRVRDLDLPMYTAERSIPRSARTFADAVYACDAMIWSTPTYHGSVSGSFKNALDWLILLAERKPPYLTNKPVGLVTTAGGIQGLQTVSAMDFIARALRAWSVPLVLPVAQSWRTFDPDGRLVDEMVGTQLRELGAEVVRAARQFHAEGTCDYADSRQFAQATARKGASVVAPAP
jgi:FMN reductase